LGRDAGGRGWRWTSSNPTGRGQRKADGENEMNKTVIFFQNAFNRTASHETVNFEGIFSKIFEKKISKKLFKKSVIFSRTLSTGRRRMKLNF
jgi:hypothetical protein